MSAPTPSIGNPGALFRGGSTFPELVQGFSNRSEMGLTTGATPVVMLTAPQGSYLKVEHVQVDNQDTVSATPIIRVNNGTINVRYHDTALATAILLEKEFTSLILEFPMTLEILLLGAVTTNELTWMVNFGQLNL